MVHENCGYYRIICTVPVVRVAQQKKLPKSAFSGRPLSDRVLTHIILVYAILMFDRFCILHCVTATGTSQQRMKSLVLSFSEGATKTHYARSKTAHKESRGAYSPGQFQY